MVFNWLKKNLNSLVLVGLLVIAGAVTLFVTHGYASRNSYLSGDEPHYIMMTDSLAKDGDLNLKNDYTEKRFLNYYPGDLMPHTSPLIDTKISDNWYSIHTPGLSILMLVPYKLFGTVGSRVAVIIVQLLSVVCLYVILKRYVKSKRKIMLGLLAWVTCSLFWQSLGAVMPDLILVTLWGISIVLFSSKLRFRTLLLMALLGLGYVVHTKGALLVGPIVLARMLFDLRGQPLRKYIKSNLSAVLIGAVIVGTYSYFLHKRYGVFSPSQLYGANGQLFSANPLTNFIAILTDRSKGLVIYAPVLLVSGVYLSRFYSDFRKQVAQVLRKPKLISETMFLWAGVLVGLLALGITQLGFLDWSGSTAPNGRYMLAFVAFIVFVSAYYFNEKNRIEQMVYGLLLGLSALVSAYVVIAFRNYMSTGVNSFIVDKVALLRHLPLFNLTSSDRDHFATRRGILLIVMLVVLNIFLSVAYRYNVTFTKEPKT